jgi:hypothetical protein
MNLFPNLRSYIPKETEQQPLPQFPLEQEDDLEYGYKTNKNNKLINIEDTSDSEFKEPSRVFKFLVYIRNYFK